MSLRSGSDIGPSWLGLGRAKTVRILDAGVVCARVPWLRGRALPHSADGGFWFATRLEARRTGADVANGSPVAVSIANEDRPYRAVIAYGRAVVWKKGTRSWLQRIATRYGEVEGMRWLAGALKEHDRVVLRLVPEKAVAWHYGTGDSHGCGRRSRSG